MKMLTSKKGFIGLWADVFKGFLAGLICGIILMVLMVLNVISSPITGCQFLL